MAIAMHKTEDPLGVRDCLVVVAVAVVGLDCCRCVFLPMAPPFIDFSKDAAASVWYMSVSSSSSSSS